MARDDHDRRLGARRHHDRDRHRDRGHGRIAGRAGPETATDPESGLTWIAVAALPAEGRETLELIDAGGPFPYERDGVVFQNREGILPDESRGYYHEYTVPTPGSDDRGARRIVTGSGGELYYTDDHYETFRRIRR